MYSVDDLKPIYKDAPKELWRMLIFLDIISLNHSVRVCEIARMVEQELNFPNEDLSEAALFHDIGKFFITTKLLNKREGLNEIERGIIDSHAYYSYKVLTFFNMKRSISLMALYHHSFDPVMFDNDTDDIEPITEDLIKKTTILRTIDIYEALTTDRPYHRGVSCKEAIRIIKSMGDYDNKTLIILAKHQHEIE